MAIDDDWGRADRLSKQARWPEAGAAWWALAGQCRDAGQEARAREAASRAADAWRRDDRPREATAALRLAWELGQSTTVDALQLAAVLSDQGQVGEARAVAEDALAGATTEDDRALAADGALQAALAGGDVGRARALLATLRAGNRPATRLALLFREAQRCRMEGDFPSADGALAQIVEALEPYHAAAAGVAAAWGERAEVAFSRAVVCRFAGRDPEPWLARAEAHADAAEDAWRKARREAGRLRNEAWRAYIRGVVAPELGEGIRYAEERGLALSAAELLGWRAGLTGDAADRDRAVALAAEAPLLRGRAVVAWAEGRRPVLPATLRDVEQDLATLLRAWATLDPDRARDMARAALRPTA